MINLLLMLKLPFILFSVVCRHRDLPENYLVVVYQRVDWRDLGLRTEMIEGVVANHLGLEGAILGLVVLFCLSLNFQLILS